LNIAIRNVVVLKTPKQAPRRTTRKHAAYIDKLITLHRSKDALTTKWQRNKASKARPVASSQKLSSIQNSMSYRDALKGKQQQQESPTNPTILHEAPQPNQLEPMFAIMQGMMEKMFSQMTQQRKYPAEEQTEVEHLIKIDNIEVVLVSESQFVADLILTSEGMT